MGDRKEMKNKFLGFIVLFVAIAMIFSSFGIANTQVKKDQIELTSTHYGKANGSRGIIVWDNRMNYDGICSAQYDEAVPFESECADDFHFEKDTNVFDVHWVAAYWNGDNYNQVHWPWEIIFYNDDGSGSEPGNIYAGPFQFNKNEYDETLIEDTGDPESGIYYEISIELPENILFSACNKYWISIQGFGDHPPQSGWAFHFNPIKLQEAVFRSDYFGFPDWTPWSEVDPPDDRDLCFQLTEKEPCNASIDAEKYVWDNTTQEWIDADIELKAIDALICTDVTFKIVVHNNETEPLKNLLIRDKMHNSIEFKSGDPFPDEVYYDEPFWYMTWFLPGPLISNDTIEINITAHVLGPHRSYGFNYALVEAEGCDETVSDDDYCWVHCLKKSKSANMALLAWLESHVNMLSLIQKMLKLVGLF